MYVQEGEGGTLAEIDVFCKLGEGSAAAAGPGHLFATRAAHGKGAAMEIRIHSGVEGEAAARLHGAWLALKPLLEVCVC